MALLCIQSWERGATDSTGGYMQNGTLFSNCCGGREKGFPYKKTCAADGFGRSMDFPAIENSVYGLLLDSFPPTYISSKPKMGQRAF